MLEKNPQNLKFILGQGHYFPLKDQVCRLKIENNTLVLQETLVIPKLIGAAQQALNLSQKDIIVKRLGNIVVCPHIDSHDNVHGLIARRQKHDRHR